MNKSIYFYYSACREHAGLTQEQAAREIGSCVRQISKYENEGGVPDDIVKAMAKLYKTPLLGWWHLKNFSPLGEFLPEVCVVKTNGDMIFQLILARDDLEEVFDSVKSIYSDGLVDDTERETYKANRDKLKVIGSKILSAQIYADEMIQNFYGNS